MNSAFRIERRFEFTDNLTWTKGKHTFKFGADANLIPTIFYQGVGQSNQPFDNKTLGIFAQDSWKVNSKLSVNYGARYDIEFLPTFPAATAVNGVAEKAFGVVQGIPTDSNNIAPRIGIAWDPWGNGKTVIRAGYGFFYDHPALALAFLSTAEDGSRSTLLESAGGSPSNADISNPANISALNASSLFQGILSSNPTPFAPAITSCSTASPTMCYGVGGNPQIFNATFSNSLFNQQRFLTVQGYTPGGGYPLPLLPFTIPVQKNFQYALAQQVNLTIEREISKDWKVSASYNYTHGTHLDHTVNINVTKPELLMANDSNAVQAGLVSIGASPLGISVPGTAGCSPTPGGGSIFVTAPGTFGTGFASANCSGVPVSNGSATLLPGGSIVTPAVFNFFRPSGPNPSFSGLFPGGYAQLAGLAGTLGLPTGFPGVIVPWSDVDPQSSNGNSLYNAFTLTVTKRFSHGFELLSSWTYAHAIDDSTDLSTLIAPQDNSFPQLDRGNSDFDQRHRWITSAVFLSPYHNSDSSFWKKVLGGFTVAPIIEVSSGRPYNLLLGEDTNLDFGSSTGRPSFVKSSTPPPGSTVSPFIPGVAFVPPNVCIDSKGQTFSFPDTIPFEGCIGNLGRNAFTRPGFFQIDLRIARAIPINDRVNLQIIADGFNMLNRFNVSDVNPVCDSTASFPSTAVATCAGGQPTAAYDPRTFQFALKVNF